MAADTGQPSPRPSEWRPALPPSLEGIPRAETLPASRHRWNTNEEIASILISFDHHESWMFKEVRIRPRSGSMLLYSRKKVRYRRDGYCWKKRKDGKTTREDHMKLKVQGTECIYGCYVHSAVLPTFHRRCYWLLQNPDTVLVHYLNVPSADDSKLQLAPLLSVPGQKEWTREELRAQLRPMFDNENGSDESSESTGSTTSVELLVQQLIERTKQAQLPSVLDKKPPTPRPPSKSSRSKSPVASLPAVPRRNKTIGTNTGPSTGSLCPEDFLDLNPMDFIDDDLAPTAHDDEVFGLVFDDMLSELPALDDLASNSSSLSGYASLLSPEPTVRIADYCPDWSPTQGGSKILVVGPWYSSGYGILVDGAAVPTTLVQSGVLRCYSPGHEPGTVPLHVTCDGRIISNTVTLEYRQTPPSSAWFDLEENGLKFSLLEKMESLEVVKQETSEQKNGEDPFEDRLLRLCRGPRNSRALDGTGPGSVTGMTALHLAAALGYTKLVGALLAWHRAEASSLELDPCGLDRKECTPLMWACAKGHTEAAILLYNAHPGTMQISNLQGDLPAEVARVRGHHQLVVELLNIGDKEHPLIKEEEEDIKDFSLNGSALMEEDGEFNRMDSPSPDTKPAVLQDFSRLTVSESQDKANVPFSVEIKYANFLTEKEVGRELFAIIPKTKIFQRKSFFTKKPSRQSKSWVISPEDSVRVKVRKRDNSLPDEESGVSAAKIPHLSLKES